MNDPWSKFFWSDYDADEGLRMCSLAAQGLWMRMLCLMARATPKGELRVGGEPCTVPDLSRATGEGEEMVAGLLGELERRGVFSTTRAGVIFCRRMRKDGEISRKRAKSGAKGAAATNLRNKENQDLLRQKPGKGVGKGSAPEARSQSSDTDVSGGKPPDDPVKAVFDLGVSVLTAAGIEEKQARSLVGKWRRDYGDARTSEALIAAGDKTEPVSWIVARLNGQDEKTNEHWAAIERKYPSRLTA